MIDTLVWVLIALVGITALGVAESARSGRLAGVRWGEVKAVAVTAVMVLLTITSAVLVIAWTIVVLMVEIWQPFLITMGVIAGVISMLVTFARHRSMFYVSAFATIAVVLLIFL